MQKKILNLYLIVLFFFQNSALACSNIVITTADRTNSIVARTFDYEFSGISFFTYIEPGTKNISNVNLYDNVSDEQVLQWTTINKVLGRNPGFSPTLGDGMNDKGLYAGTLYLPNFTKYPEYNPNNGDNRPVLGVFDIISYVLGTSSNVTDAIEKLDKVQIVRQAMKLTPAELSIPIYAIPPLHIVLRDQSGCSAIIEFIGGQTKIYRNCDAQNSLDLKEMNSVVTNAPPYDWQIDNAETFNDTISGKNKDIKFDNSYMNGSGFYGVPGDWTPPSRFVRAYQLIRNMPKPKTTNQAKALALEALHTVEVPLGVNPAPTAWETMADLANAKYYFKNLFVITPGIGSGKPNLVMLPDVIAKDPIETPWEVIDLKTINHKKNLWIDGRIVRTIIPDIERSRIPDETSEKTQPDSFNNLEFISPNKMKFTEMNNWYHKSISP